MADRLPIAGQGRSDKSLIGHAPRSGWQGFQVARLANCGPAFAVRWGVMRPDRPASALYPATAHCAGTFEGVLLWRLTRMREEAWGPALTVHQGMVEAGRLAAAPGSLFAPDHAAALP